VTDALAFLINPLRQILFFLHNNLGLSYALGIIVMTIALRLILTPLTIKQYTAMRAMQKIQPLMKELQAKFKDDRQKLNEETMKLYREHKVNPFGSCLPMLIQLPITMALYYMIRSQPFTTDNSFLWISNINDPDRILLVFYVLSQLGSSLMLTTTTDKSQRMLMLIMPVAIGFLVIGFPAGALLFWVTSNLLMLGQQLIVREVIKGREAREELAIEPAAEPPQPKTGGKPHAGKPKSKKKRR
jgi:YidC/Oxa1 family membrane protein insertase